MNDSGIIKFVNYDGRIRARVTENRNYNHLNMEIWWFGLSATQKIESTAKNNQKISNLKLSKTKFDQTS